jgi:hypothetical protein
MHPWPAFQLPVRTVHSTDKTSRAGNRFLPPARRRSRALACVRSAWFQRAFSVCININVCTSINEGQQNSEEDKEEDKGSRGQAFTGT